MTLERIEARAGRIADEAVARARRHLAERLAEPGIGVEETDNGVVLSGRGLWLRLLASGQLRWTGGVFR